MCPPWAVSALISTCPPPGDNLLLASQLSSAAAQALAAAGVAYSSLSVHGAVVPVQSAQLCAVPSATAGRHLLAPDSTSGVLSAAPITHARRSPLRVWPTAVSACMAQWCQCRVSSSVQCPAPQLDATCWPWVARPVCHLLSSGHKTCCAACKELNSAASAATIPDVELFGSINKWIRSEVTTFERLRFYIDYQA